MPGKLHKFAEVESFSNCFFLPFEQKEKGLALKGKWREEYFKNNNPIVVELGCGRGEYTIGLAEPHPEKNFIGIDIKGARIWTGARYATDKNLKNVAFVRTRIDFVEACFAENEVDEIWITFPDPQPQKGRERKRLTNHLFLSRYMKFLKPGGLIHLKTDNTGFYEFTLESFRSFAHPDNPSTRELEEIFSTDDLYNNVPEGREELTRIKTYYEKMFTERGERVKYCLFRRPSHG
jgi:tRNA (guanine-N7-)-methyltransferase